MESLLGLQQFVMLCMTHFYYWSHIFHKLGNEKGYDATEYGIGKFSFVLPPFVGVVYGEVEATTQNANERKHFNKIVVVPLLIMVLLFLLLFQVVVL